MGIAKGDESKMNGAATAHAEELKARDEGVASSEATQAPRRLDIRTISSLGLFALLIVIALLMATQGGNLLEEAERDRLVETIRNSPWAPVLMVLTFILGGLSGVLPQWFMIASAAFIFGPVMGFGLSWTGTMISSFASFWLGKTFGGDLLQRFGGPKAKLVGRKLAEHGVITTIMIRVIPTGLPFVVVNMMAAAANISLVKFLFGSGVGTIPKMALIAFGLDQIIQFISAPSLARVVLVVAFILMWVALAIWGRRRFRRWMSDAPAGEGTPVPGAGMGGSTGGVAAGSGAPAVAAASFAATPDRQTQAGAQASATEDGADKPLGSETPDQEEDSPSQKRREAKPSAAEGMPPAPL